MKKKIAELRAAHAKLEAANRQLLERALAGEDLNAEEQKQLEMVTAEAKSLSDKITELEARATALEGMALAEVQQTETVTPTPVRGSGFRGLGEFALCVVNASNPAGGVDPRLYRAATGMSEGMPSDGGFLVGTDLAAPIVKELYGGLQVWNRARNIVISANSNGVKIPMVNETSRASTRWGGILGYWIAEAGAKTASAPKVRQIELNLKKLVALCYATDELLSDASALESFLTQGFTEEFQFQLDDAAINGTGAGKPLGILNGGSTASISKETGQATATIVSENIFKMYAAMPAGSLGNAVWFVNQNCWPQLFKMHVAVGTGGVPVFVPAGGISASPYGTLLGRPIIPIEQCATLGTVGDIIFADMSQYVTCSKGGIESAVSIHLKFNYDESCFRWILRVDGQPMWNSALTPYRGSASSISPYVTLATRS